MAGGREVNVTQRTLRGVAFEAERMKGGRSKKFDSGPMSKAVMLV